MVEFDRLLREKITMWLPTSVYERVPQFWLVLGLLFMVSGLYLGTEYHMAFLYVGVGVACFLWGVAIAVWRRRFRSDPLSQTVVTTVDEIRGKDDS
jgi:hypothetical protein